MKSNPFMQNQQRICYHEFLSRLDGIVHWYQEQELLVYLRLPGITKWRVQFNALLRAAGYALIEVATVLLKDPYIHAPEVLAEGGGIHCITYNFKNKPN